jgi:hypothetical protein
LLIAAQAAALASSDVLDALASWRWWGLVPAVAATVVVFALVYTVVVDGPRALKGLLRRAPRAIAD